MTLHTPTPWKQGANKLYVFQDCSLNKEHIAVMSARPDGYYGQDENEANAAFIVRAVNSFEPLVQIAEAYRNLLRTMAHTEGQVATFQHIESVLAAAKEEVTA